MKTQVSIIIFMPVEIRNKNIFDREAYVSISLVYAAPGDRYRRRLRLTPVKDFFSLLLLSRW